MTVECVPNFSEGRNHVTISALAQAVSRTPGARLLDQTSDPDHNRTVLTLLGDPESISNAALAAIRVAVQTIDLTKQTGVHPRIGAADVVPFIPLEDITLEQCAEFARQTGQRIWNELGVPVYLYEAAALRPECRRLEYIRKYAPVLPPDFGIHPHPTAGCCVVGARNFLIAWNINLNTTDLSAARTIAREIRESSGGLPAVKALGLPLESRSQVQVSINLVDFGITPMHIVFDAVAASCRRKGIEIAGSELIGMIPPAALAASEGYDLHWQNLTAQRILTL
ncbi:MAG: glutamate formiminotransferase / formiminotetrahydrofolate cyclodeaminase [Bryobacterales bacterium]|jgi:glutamate formiminotransferase|nr:glutamate formiminotransferase / formiminotetrahydrofolate cyclodeaminase [Bryobacterales bacterium]